MRITAAQCRAARSLLDWTQEHLATNANVSRATIVEFESSTRLPIKNNLKAIADCMFSAGVEFLSEEATAGVGVRFREQKLEYSKNVNIDRYNKSATVRMRYAGKDFKCMIDLNAIDDYHRTNFSTDAEFRQAISNIFPIVLAAVERSAPTSVRDGELRVTCGMLKMD